MGQFFKFLFASCLGTMLALGALVFLFFSMAVGMAGSFSSETKKSVSPNSVLDLDFSNAIPEKTDNIASNELFETESVLGLTDIVTAIQKAKTDDDIKGIYLHPLMFSSGKATASVLRNALVDFKTSGKFIYAYADAYSQNAYYIASVADSVYCNPMGLVEVRGLSSTMMYYKQMLDKLKVQMRIFYAGKFKSATEPLRMDKMSDENRLQVREYINGLYDVFIRDIAKSRNVSEADLRKIADNFDGFDVHKAVESKLIDRVAYEDEPISMMKKALGLEEKDKINKIGLEDYFSSRVKKLDLSIKDKIAVVYCEGELGDAEGENPGAISGDQYVKLLRKIRMDDKVKAIVLRINSPGGSVLASDKILRELQLCKDAGKPIVVSMGDVAASGGYYITCASDSIFAETNTITGSIGVFATIPILQQTMKEHLGITIDTVKTGRFSAFGTPMIDFSPEEGQILQAHVESIYENFLHVVAKSRHKTRDQIHEIAQGRVWTGKKAVELGLVDAIGGLDRAVEAAKKLAGIEKARLAEFPRAKKPIEQLMDKLTKKESEETVKSWFAREELGEMYPIYETLKTLKEKPTIQARLPYELIVR